MLTKVKGGKTSWNRAVAIALSAVLIFSASVVSSWTGAEAGISDNTVYATGSSAKPGAEPMGVAGSSETFSTEPMIATGIHHTIALKADGTVWAWGNNASGQLGSGFDNQNFSYSPIQVSGISDVVSIASGDYHTLALKSDGTVWAWGCNQYGQLGDGTTDERHTPVEVIGENGIGYFNVYDSGSTGDSPTGEVDQEKFIKAHFNFAVQKLPSFLRVHRQAQLLYDADNNVSNWAECIFDGVENTSEILSGKSLSVFDNEYKVLLTDYIMSQSNAEMMENIFNSNLVKNTQLIAETTNTFLRAQWDTSKFGPLDPKDALKFVKYNGEDTSTLTKDGLNDVFGKPEGKTFFEGMDVVFDVASAGQEVWEYVLDCLNYAVAVDTYVQTTSEFKQVLNMMTASDVLPSHTYHSQRLKSAIESFTQYDGLSEQEINKRVQQEFWKKGVKLSWNLFGGMILDVTKKWLTKGLGAKALQSVTAVPWAFNTGWSIGKMVTGAGDVVDCREMLRANYYFESALVKVVLKTEQTFLSNQSYGNARVFHEAFLLLNLSEQYSVDFMVKALKMQNKNIFTIVANWAWGNDTAPLIDSFTREKGLIIMSNCCGTLKGVDTPSNSKMIVVACPTDVELYDKAGNSVLTIKNNEVLHSDNEISASVADEVKYIHLPTDDIFGIKITGTGVGKMDYQLRELDADGKITRIIAYSDMSLVKAQEYIGEIDKAIGASSSNYNLSTEGVVIEASADVSADDKISVDAIVSPEKEITIAEKETRQLTVSVLPETATIKTIVYTSGNPGVASVNSLGELVGNKAGGTTTVTAIAIDSGVSVSWKVIVPEPPKDTGVNEDNDKDVNKKVSLSDSNKTQVAPVKDRPFTGKQIKPALAVKLGSKALKAGTDYTVSYGANVAIGKGMATITGKGAYKDTKAVTFNIVPTKLSIAKLTVGKKRVKVAWKAAPKAQGITKYQIRYALKGKIKWKTITVSSKKLNVVVKKLKKNKRYTFQIRSYKTVSGANYYAPWSAGKVSKRVK